MEQIVDYLSRFEQWPIWEKILWALPVIGVIWLIRVLFGILLNEQKSTAARALAGVALFVVTLAALTFAVMLYGISVERRYS